MTTTTDLVQHTDQIRRLNDSFRKGEPHANASLGRWIFTRGVTALVQGDNAQMRELLAKVQSFDSFDEANDPHGEHDFFSFEFKGKTLFAKMDYYDRNIEFGSENPADPSKTMRVLTIMLSEEY